jgi:hypothetical protein
MNTATNAVTAPVLGGAVGTLVLYLAETYAARADFPLAVDTAIITICIFLAGLVVRPTDGP